MHILYGRRRRPRAARARGRARHGESGSSAAARGGATRLARARLRGAGGAADGQRRSRMTAGGRARPSRGTQGQCRASISSGVIAARPRSRRAGGRVNALPLDTIAERIQSLGGIGLAMAADVAETTIIPRPPKGREEVPVQISRLLHAHEIVLEEARSMARQAAESGDDGTNDLLVSDLIRTNEKQVWFLSEHLVDVPLVKAD